MSLLNNFIRSMSSIPVDLLIDLRMRLSNRSSTGQVGGAEAPQPTPKPATEVPMQWATGDRSTFLLCDSGIGPLVASVDDFIEFGSHKDGERREPEPQQ